MLSDETQLRLAEIQKPMEDWRVLVGCCALSMLIGVPALYALSGGEASIFGLLGGLIGIYWARDELKKAAERSRERRLELERRVNAAAESSGS